MNKNDILLLIIVIIIIVLLFIFNYSNTNAKIAYVYHDDDLILTIDLNKDNTYEVNGDKGKVLIEVKDNKIRVLEETSNYHLCSKQGYIKNEGESIICLPNKIIIELPTNEVDVEVK